MTKTKIPKLSSLIESHKFDWVNSYITDELFEKPEQLETDFKLFHFDRYISSEDAIKDMLANGYRPANAWELLSWKDWDNNNWVVALGSVGEVGGGRRVPSLGGGGSGRGLDLDWRDGGWGADCRFLGVRNGSAALGALEPGNSDTLNLEARVSAIEKWIRGVKDQLL